MGFRQSDLAHPDRCVCGRHWDDHANQGKAPSCTNPDCCDGGVGYDDDTEDPARDCPTCRGLGVLPCAGEPGAEDACYDFAQDLTTIGEEMADARG